jgi:antitoxin HicB
MKPQYSMVIEWSEADQTYVVSIPEFAGRVMMPCTDGATYEEAARSGQEVVETFLEIWQEEGKPIPPPRSHTASAA